VTVFSILSLSFISLISTHDLRPDVGLLRWFGLELNEKAALALVNTLMLNSLLFIGEFAQILCGMRELGVDEFSLLNFKNIILAPFFEEFIYRVVIINIFLEADVMSVNKCVVILPIFFAVGKRNALFTSE
jgi:hypothetical protein